MDDKQKWPDVLWIVRHGESAGNVARDKAEAAGLPEIELGVRRDVDVPLSERGEEQARALGHWFGKMHEDDRPTVVLTSPYLRAKHTAEIALGEAGIERDNITFISDERLREKEFGVLDRLTKFGIEAKFPDQLEFRRAIGKFYHRPPGGESWCDVILRLRNVIDTLTREYRRERVLVVAHSVVVLCFRYLLERMTEEQILEIDRATDVANCAVTSYAYDPGIGKHGKLVLRQYNFVAPLEQEGAPVTTQKDVPVAPK
ncbi:MAG TPA: histidine phosphatase family protein [Pyrinomonadaceae bacterium]|nr:histidine phosphatase family protein [Pyrinomonadaceae bacterium]